MKKFIVLLLALVLTICSSVSGTLAYIQISAQAAEVHTDSGVHIEQIEQEWNAGYTDLTNLQGTDALYPCVGDPGWETTESYGNAYRRFTMENAVDKYVSVKNTGIIPAYVRTFIALEMGSLTEAELNSMIGLSINSADGAEFDFPGTWQWNSPFVAAIGGHNYYIMTAVHETALAAGQTTIPSLLQIYLSRDAGNRTLEQLDGNGNGTYDILLCSQAAQTTEFDSAASALNTIFGDPAAQYHPWIEKTDPADTK